MHDPPFSCKEKAKKVRFTLNTTVLLLVVVTTAASICLHLGYSLQKKGAQKLKDVLFGFRNIMCYLKTKRWVLGFLTTLIGTALIIFALRIGPISTVQPLLGCGLIFLVLFSRFYLKEHLSSADYVAVFLVIAGVIFLGLSTSDIDISSAFYEPRLLFGFVAFVMLIVSVALILLKVICGGFKMDIWYGIVSGLFFAFASLFMRAMFNGMRVLPQNNFFWFIPLSATSAVIGFSLIQRGFNHGRAVVVILFSDTANQLTVITGGLFCFKERLPSEPFLLTMKLSAFVLIVIGSMILSRFGRVKT